MLGDEVQLGPGLLGLKESVVCRMGMLGPPAGGLIGSHRLGRPVGDAAQRNLFLQRSMPFHGLPRTSSRRLSFAAGKPKPE
jgi:hypothetical protein